MDHLYPRYGGWEGIDVVTIGFVEWWGLMRGDEGVLNTHSFRPCACISPQRTQFADPHAHGGYAPMKRFDNTFIDLYEFSFNRLLTIYKIG